MRAFQIHSSSAEESKFVRKSLVKFNAEHVAEEIMNVYEEINLNIKNHEGTIIGGLNSAVCWNWIEVDILWVDQNFRGHGVGSKLMNEIELIARQKGCTFIKLNTFSFQAPEFYKKHGYKEIAVIDNAPRGYKHYYLMKEL
ncbi:GNAT family N-acetyltransferase [Cohnella pontilimi]|uniref:GNAT family N-acetyltransferase n=1 Tax=Cohnella pontilimi TaxID=2564100 RepID=A0A4U0F945_9BACL|nr:GNAT family N-acetyltransferase [Cohnella pontilimi]TJY41090.1 GNAT family N-acetyltransferase [Cohnella pontilimi]